ncbi:MAG TPA: hypothetical protein PKN48_05250 [Bacteroidales bacterium]|nr:hypothetical protein [Bacteroidales bacterium]HNW89047.1 hypothetical protein [Bacteroidales bacterium]
MNTLLSPKTVSKAFPTKVIITIAEIILLLGIGALGVVLHARFRFPLRIPGHWGVVYMALVFSGRLFSKKPYASSLSSVGAASMLLLPLGFSNPFMPVLYVLPGFLVDVFYKLFSAKNKTVVFTALVAGLAYMTIPLIRIIISLTTGVAFGSFLSGFYFPLIMHFVFGACGGLIALGFFVLIKKYFKQ